jgi:hypothetical protein
MKRNLLLILLLLAFAGIKAQTTVPAKHLSTTDMEFMGHPSKYYLNSAEADEGYFFVYSAEKDSKKVTKAIIYKVDKDLRSEKSSVISFPSDDYEFIGCTDNNESIIAFYSVQDKKADILSIKKVVFDKNNIEAAANIEEITSMPFDNRDACISLTATSQDKSKFSINILHTSARGDFSGIYTAVFNGGELLWSNHEIPSLENENFDISDMQVSNEGVAYIGISSYSKKGLKSENEKFQLYVINENEGQLYTESVEYGVIRAMKLKLLRNGNLFIGGYYSENLLENGTGSFSYIFNPATAEFTSSTHQEFSEDYKSAPRPDVFITKYANQQYTVVCQYIFELDNGKIVMLGEQKYIKTVVTRTNNTVQTSYVIFAKNILSNSFNANGEYENFAMYNKHQGISTQKLYSYDPRDFLLSYYAVQKGNNIYLMYNDNTNNVLRGSTKDEIFELNTGFSFIKKNSCLTLATLDENGDLSKEKVMDCSAIGRVLNKILYFDGDDVMFATFGKKTNSISKITLPN